MASVETHILCFNEQDILPYSLRHYTSFCERVIVHDAFSKDRSREIAKEYGAEVRDWICPKLDDTNAKRLKEQSMMSCALDWCIVVDADEILFFPQGAFHSLGSYDASGLAIIKPHGFELVSDTFPTTQKQIYDECTIAGVDDYWYGKSVLAAPKRISEITYSVGAHQCWATLKDGSRWDNRQDKTDPPCYLLHCKHLGSIERIARKYDVQRTRLSDNNVKHKWGNFDPGLKHSMDKRRAILSTAMRFI